jgi:hypothetical protein
MKFSWLAFGVGLFFATATVDATAQDERTTEQLAKARLKAMESAVAGFKVKRAGAEAPHFASKPLLRYSDPTRNAPGAAGLLDAAVWRLGESGRPLGLLTLEIYNDAGTAAVLSYEFAALSEHELGLTHSEQKTIAWETPAKALVMQPLAGAPEPADAAAGRLVQMRQLVRRFKVSEIFEDITLECRLLTQPIDRYSSADDKITDGAIFVFANGTNPEVGVLVECGPAGWSFGFVRLTSAESYAELDGKKVATFAKGDFRLVKRGPYLADANAIEIAK